MRGLPTALLLRLIVLLIGSAPAIASAQLAIWVEEFENSCTTGCYASAFSGVNGAWTVVNSGTNGTCPNRWFVSCAENGNQPGQCGSACGNNESLHVGNELPAACASPNGYAFCPTGDCGAAYDAGCPPASCATCTLLGGNCFDVTTDQRATSPVINLVGKTTITLTFNYIEKGSTTLDNAGVEYYDGTTWTLLADMPQTPTGGCGTQGTWTSYSVALPVTANNNPNVRIGFRWVNNNDGVGGDPSFAVDDVRLTVPYVPMGIGLIVNELSNGPTGAQEYIELLAVGPTCSTIDIRGIIVDDNNGVQNNGFGTTMSGSGVSIGHTRFSNAAQWATVPVGSLILIYNNTDPNVLRPTDDPTDTSPNDSVYVLPANHALLQTCTTYPSGTLTSNYPPCTYGTAQWLSIAYRDQGDAGQTRDATGHYFHGISYGPNIQNMNSGGLDLLRISTASQAGRVIYFTNGNYRLAANFISALVAGNETPGAPNNGANRNYRLTLQCDFLPIELLSFTAMQTGAVVRTEWVTATERDNDYFTLERSPDGSSFLPIGTVDGAGDSQWERHYVFDDGTPLNGVNYYRLRQTDFDGTATLSATIAVQFSAHDPLVVTPDGNGGWILGAMTAPGEWTLLDMLGRPVAQGRTMPGVPTVIPGNGLSEACYSLRVSAGAEVSVLKLALAGAFGTSGAPN